MNKKQIKFNISKKVSLPIQADATSAYIPTSKNYENNKKILEQIGIAINENMPVLLIGETGTGKTSLVRFLASKTNNSFRRVNHNGATTIDDLLGHTLINQQGTFWQDGVLTEALRKGFWYLADEINASNADINFIYHSLLDDDGFIVLPENNGEIVKPHPNFRFFGAMNPSADYTGAKELNKALLSRFVVIKTDYPNPAVEQKILVSRIGIDSKIANLMITFANEIRANHQKEKISFVLSTRELLTWSKLFLTYQKFLPSAEMSILNKVNADDFDAVKDLLALHFKCIDDPSKKAEPVKPVIEPEKINQ